MTDTSMTEPILSAIAIAAVVLGVAGFVALTDVLLFLVGGYYVVRYLKVL